METTENKKVIVPSISNYEMNAPSKTAKGNRITSEQSMKRAFSFLKKLIAVCPEFAASLTFVVYGCVLQFEHGNFRFQMEPRFFGIDPVNLKHGDIVTLSRSWIEDESEKTHKGAYKSIVKPETLFTTKNAWCDGFMLASGTVPNVIKDTQQHDDFDFGMLLNSFENKEKAVDCSIYENDVYKVENKKVVSIGGGLFNVRPLNFLISNTDKKKETSFTVVEKNILGIRKNGEIYAVLMGERLEKGEEQIISGKWKMKGLSNNPAIDIPLKRALEIEPEQGAADPVAVPEPEQAAADPVAVPEIIEHTTKRGKVLRGVIRTDLTKEQAQEIDKYTFKKGDGWFIREKHLEGLQVAEPVAVAPAQEEIEPQGYMNGSTWYGGKYDKNLSLVAIAQKIRADLKNEALKNPLFSGSKFSVRKTGYNSLTIEIKEIGFNPYNPERIKLDLENDRSYGETIYTAQGKDLETRIKHIANAYNFDGSDLSTDYFHVNFYQSTNIDYELSQKLRKEIENDIEKRLEEYRKALVESWPACSQCGKKEEYLNDIDGKTGLCFECYYPLSVAKKERENAIYQAQVEEIARLVTKISDITTEPAEPQEPFLYILEPSLNKNCTLGEYLEQLENGNCNIIRGKVTERARLTNDQFDILAVNLMAALPWLAGKGGTGCDIDFPGVENVNQLNDEQLQVYRENCYSLFIEVSAPNRETIYIDPQGYNYARYVGFKSPQQPEPPEPDKPSALAAPKKHVIKFEVGKTYFTRSICDHNTIYKITIATRTEKTVKTTKGKIYRPRVITNSAGQEVERIAMGNYSMAGSWKATDTTELLPDWKQPAAIAKKEQEEQTERALNAFERLASGDYINEVINDYNQGHTTTGTAKTACMPANRWNNIAQPAPCFCGAVKVSQAVEDASQNPTSAWLAIQDKFEVAPVAVPVAAPVAVPVAVPAPIDEQLEPEQAVELLEPSEPVEVSEPSELPEPPEPPEPAAPKAKPFPVADLPENDEQFYPTPANLAGDMVRKIEGYPRSVLDPSAGKGDLLDRLNETFKYKSYHMRLNCFAIEKDNNLRAILQGKKYPVIDADFLAWSGPDKFDCIIMNPPFSTGDRHLLKAIDVMYSGQIICLLNAETLRNPYTNTRKELARQLDELGAEVEYREKQFLGADRKTAVDIALVKIKIERHVEDDLFTGTTGTIGTCKEHVKDKHEVSNGKTIEELAAQYREIVELSTNTIIGYFRNYNKVGRYITLNQEPRSTWSSESGKELTDKVQETVNSTVRSIRVDFWRRTLDLPEVKDRLTEKRREEFEAKLKDNESMDFTESNIRQFLLNLIDGYHVTLQEGVDEVFERLTIRNSYHEELRTQNIHYFNGWKTNNAYRVGERVIIPVYGSYGGPFTSWGSWDLNWKAKQSLNDIDLVMSYFNGGRQYKRLTVAIEEAFKQGEQSGKSTFFKFKCHKKGTIHLTFLDKNILRRFNVAACMGKGWLPGDYGKKPFRDMSKNEKTVVESFEVGGNKVYTENLNQHLFDATIKNIDLIEG